MVIQNAGDAAGSGRSVAELERVVSAMRKVVEKLQRENDGLKKTVSRVKKHQQQSQHEGDTSDSTGKLEAENKRLRVSREVL